MDILQSMEKSLRTLNYPGINTMNHEDIAAVFSSTNRLNFLIWFYEQLGTDEPLPLQTQVKCRILADVMYENGLCSSSEKLPFVKGDDSLDPLRQVVTYFFSYCLRHVTSFTLMLLSGANLSTNF